MSLTCRLLVFCLTIPALLSTAEPDLPDFSYIPSGSFTMGSPSDEPGRKSDEGPQHQVTLSEAFFLQQTSVTWAQWNAVRDWGLQNGYSDLATGRKGSHGDSRNTDEEPVTMISWLDAVKWLNARSEMEGLTPAYRVGENVYRTGTLNPVQNVDANGYRLPTEAEWEYAARAGTTTAFHSGPITFTGVGPLDPNLDQIGWYGGNSGGQTRPVGQKEANAFGLYDMSGNVGDWCGDWWLLDYPDEPVTDPTGADSGVSRAYRGGYWGSNADSCRSASRSHSHPGGGGIWIGFRPALPLSGYTETGLYGPMTYKEFETYAVITDCETSAAGELVVPSSINEKPVTSINEFAFADCGSLTNIVLPDSLQSIGDAAFRACIGLTSIALPENVTSIGDGAFLFCTNLSSITIPDGISSLQQFMFFGCGNLAEVILPPDLTSIGALTFYGCSSLSRITIPDGVTSISQGLFTNCSSLTNIVLPDGLTSIGDNAFDGCSSLTSIIIPSEVNSIGSHVFANCSNLVRATFLGDAPSAVANSLRLSPANFTTYHFEGSSGFTTPTWFERPSVNLGNFSHLKPWLMDMDLAYDLAPGSDLNGDGVSLLMAYALGLDPHANLAGFLPLANFTDGILKLPYYAKAKGIVYVPETSTDLVNWTSSGVTLSEPDADGLRIASIPVDGAIRFLRLRVEH